MEPRVARSTSPPGSRLRWSPTLLVPLAYLVVGFAIYGKILFTYFLADDFAYLYDISLAHSPAIVFSALAGRYFRPMVVLVYYLNFQVSGLDPFTYHASVVLLNVANASLVFFLARSLSAPALVAPLAGLLFLVFGGHAEAITWIAGMADPLVTLFVLAALLLFLDALRAERWRPRVAAVWVVFAAALLSKESAAALPGMLIAVTMLAAPGPGRARWRVLAITLAGMAAVVAAYLILRTSVLGFTLVRLEGLGTNQHLIAMTRAFAIRSFLPQGGLALTIFQNRFDVLVGVPLVVLLLWGQRRAAIQPLVLIGVCFGLALAPVLPLSIALGSPESERLIYMASAFAMLGLVWFLALATQRAPMLIALVAILATGNLSALSRVNQNWREAAALIERSLPAFAAAMRSHGKPGRPVFVLNVPDSVRGAYVFRRGFHEALRLAAPDQLAGLGDMNVLSVYTVTDVESPVKVAAAGPRSLDVHLQGGALIGTANPPTPRLTLRDWSTGSFGVDFTPAADGGLVLYFTPGTLAVLGSVPFQP